MTKKSSAQKLAVAAGGELQIDCPCRKHGCPRRLNCAACRQYHYEKNGLPKCERGRKEPRKTALFRFAHVNLIARDSAKLIAFYKDVFDCRSIGETRDLSGDWLTRMTSVTNAHIVGEHLLLPGYGVDHPTLEIFSYDPPAAGMSGAVNEPGFQHIAFEVPDVAETLSRVLANGGRALGELVQADYADGRRATFVYARDPEGNILELQSWKLPN